MSFHDISAGNYMFKVKNRNTSCEICSKLTIKTPEQHQFHHSSVFIVNFEHISHLVLVFMLLILRRWMPAGIMHYLFSTTLLFFTEMANIGFKKVPPIFMKMLLNKVLCALTLYYVDAVLLYYIVSYHTKPYHATI